VAEPESLLDPLPRSVLVDELESPLELLLESLPELPELPDVVLVVLLEAAELLFAAWATAATAAVPPTLRTNMVPVATASRRFPASLPMGAFIGQRSAAALCVPPDHPVCILWDSRAASTPELNSRLTGSAQVSLGAGPGADPTVRP
jgi:hypothetical protein